MTATCPDFDTCALCRGEACNACGREPRPPGKCPHDPIERHSGLPPIEARAPTPTVPLERAILGGRIEVDLADGDQVAGFLELVARIARAKGRLILIVE